LRKDAHLLLGSAESNGGRDDLYQAVSKKWRIFLRTGSARLEPMALASASGPAANLRHGTLVQPSPTVLPSSLAATVAQKLLLDRFVPAAILVNSQSEALYFCGPTDEFLMRPRGAPTLNVLTLVREGLRSRLQTTLREAVTQDLPATSVGASMKQGKGFVPVLITVTPVQNPELGRVFLVVFQFDHKPALIPLDQRADMVVVRHLEEDLQLTRDELQDTIERYEATHDNLRLSNEEVITANEELRSLNEELESSKEELQSLNEELTMVNQQLEAKLRELEVANADLNNLLNSSDVATLCLDQSLRIKWFAPATQKQFNFIAADIGRPVSDVAAALGDATLLPAARLVLARQPVSDLEFAVASGRWYIRRVLPYRTDAEQISGVIVTYTDVTESRQAMAAAIATRRDLSASMEQTSKLRALSAALALAEERERRALARDLHDDLGQLMAVIAVKAAVVQRQKMPVALKRAVDECVGAVEMANRKLRTMALQLNPPMLDQLGLVPALEWMADEIHQTYQIEVHVEDDGAPKPMDPAVSATLFRAVRELLINVARHAKVRRATVQTVCNPAGMLDVTVRDAGAGFDVTAALPALAAASLTGDVGVGLLGVRERIGYLGGEMQVHSAPGEGTSVLIRVPLLPALAPVKKPRARRRV
jgi:two-component system CheB/CheR fusion protein